MNTKTVIVIVFALVVFVAVLSSSLTLNFICIKSGCSFLNSEPTGVSGKLTPISSSALQPVPTSVTMMPTESMSPTRKPMASEFLLTNTPSFLVTLVATTAGAVTSKPDVQLTPTLPKAVVITPTPKPRILSSQTLTEEQATKFLAAKILENGLPITDVRISFIANENVQIVGRTTAEFNYGSVSGIVKVISTPQVVRGNCEVRVQSVVVDDSVNMTGIFKMQIEKSINDTLSDLIGDLRVESCSLIGREMKITGYR